MSFYFRKAGEPGALPLALMRALTLLVLAAYPAGGIVMLVQPERVMADIAGFGLIVLALIGAALIAPSWLQRIVGEQAKHLDDFELDLRRRANAVAYQIFTVLTLLGLLYMGVASDSTRLALWTPSTFDHWNAIIWGAILFAFVLPTTVLAWIAPAPVQDEEAGEA